MKKIFLPGGHVAIVDAEDYESLTQWKWHFNKGYAVRKAYVGVVDGKEKYKNIRIHRLVIKAPEDLQVDHINGNRLDNRKSNLRLCSAYQNNLNRCGVKNTSSKYKGVSWRGYINKWTAQIEVNGKYKHIGCFYDECDAALAYNLIAAEYFSEFAYFNKAT